MIATASAQGATVTIHDQTFAAGTWSAAILGGSNVSSVSVSQLVGQGVTGNALQTTIGGVGSYTFDVRDFKTDRSFVPASEGIIQSVSYEYWHKTQNASQFAGWRLAARQGGDTFIANSTYAEPQLYSANWQKVAGTVTPDAFQRATGSGSPTISVAADAAPIEFGFVLSRGVFQSGTTSCQSSFFTVDLTVTPVPEPAGLGGLAGLLGLLARRPRLRATRA